MNSKYMIKELHVGTKQVAVYVIMVKETFLDRLFNRWHVINTAFTSRAGALAMIVYLQGKK